MRLKLWGNSNSTSKHAGSAPNTTAKYSRNIKSSPYASTVASAPPVKGSYPVAGNGPGVLEELQRSRAQKELNTARRHSVHHNGPVPIPTPVDIPASKPTHPRPFSGEFERPRTAPSPGAQHGGHFVPAMPAGDDNGRTRSGFSMKSPPGIFSKRPNSTKSTRGNRPAVPQSIPEVPRPPREIKTYQPKKALDDAPLPPLGDVVPPPPPLPFAHVRTSSQASHKSYVDILDAHSAIRPSREVSTHRAKASGMRSYGEDVADRNLAQHIEGFDIHSPEFSYLKSVYGPAAVYAGSASSATPTPNTGRKPSEAHPRHPLARGSVLGRDGESIGDDIQPHPQASSKHAAHSPRGDSHHASAANRHHHDGHGSLSSHVTTGPERAFSPLSLGSGGGEGVRRPSTGSSRPPVSYQASPRGRTRTSPREPPPVPTSIPRITARPQPLQTTPQPNGRFKLNQRTGSSGSQSILASSSNSDRRKHRQGSVSFSPLPNMNTSDNQANPTFMKVDQLEGTASQGREMAITGSEQPLSLDGVVDLTNTVDADVTTTTLPAVTHEHVIPTRHEIREERITREIHTHDVFHRILPVIDVEILPTKHFVHSLDGKGLIEVPESQIPGRTMDGSPSRNWQIVETALGKGDHGAAFHRQPQSHRTQSLAQSSGYSNIYENKDEENDSAEPPVVGLVRGEKLHSQSRRKSLPSSNDSRSASMKRRAMEPILTSKKETITKDGHPKTEYVWRHPPRFETADGKTYPMYIGAELGDLSTSSQPTPQQDDARRSVESEDSAGADYGAVRTNENGQENTMFRDSGYGPGPSLPGLPQHGSSPLAVARSSLVSHETPRKSNIPRTPADVFDEKIQYGRVVDDHYADGSGKKDNASADVGKGKEEGQSTKALRRIKERRSEDKGKGREGSDVSTLRIGLGKLGF